MNPVNDHKTDTNVCEMFDQITQSISGTVTHISQVATGTKNWHKRKQG